MTPAWCTLESRRYHRAVPLLCIALFASLLVAAGCGAASQLPADAGAEADGCGEEMLARCAFLGVWIFPTEACALDHTAAVGLCAESRAVLASPPEELGGYGTVSEGTWAPVVSPDLVAVTLPDVELSLQLRFDDDSLLWRDPDDGCVQTDGYRIDDPRLELPWDPDWARGLCD